jgi:alkylation response protein AidB-like acyl-CoA dehydrogenase
MIDFEPGDELSLLQETTRAFATQWLRPRERDHEAAREIGAEVREAYEKIGLSSVELPERLGGAGLGALARALVLEELGAADPGAALALDPLGPALYALQELGDVVFDELAAPLLRGAGARALVVPRGAIRTEGERLCGGVPWAPTDRVDLLVVLDGEEILVVRDGIELGPVRGAGLRAAGASSLSLVDAPVCAHIHDADAATRARARGRLYVAALLVGVMRAASETSREYALERVTFGRPIAHHQSLAFLIADLASALEGSRLLLWEAAWRLDAGRSAGEACATAFVEAAEQAMFVTPNALQILGGHGFMQDYPLEKWMREARALGLLFGGVDAAREEAGSELVACAPPVPLTAPEA